MENIYTQVKDISSNWKTDNIYVIGKGPSIDNFRGLPLGEGIIININDTEKIIQGDIGIFSANWVRHSLKESGFNCKYYLAGKPIPTSIPHEVLPPIPFEFDDEELSTLRLTQEEFFDEPFVLTNAIKLSLLLGSINNKKPNVYFLGFDFSTDEGEISKAIKIDYASEEPDRKVMIHSHENDFIQFARYFEDNPIIELIHVGKKFYSKLDHEKFVLGFSNKVQSKTTQTTPKAEDIPSQNGVLIVAEFTNNHLGDEDRLFEMIERAKDAGADLIKIQKRDVNTFYTDDKLKSYYWSPFGKTLREYREGVELNEEQLKILDNKCKEVGINWFCSVLDYPSFKVIEKFNPDLIKIPSTISNHRDFHKRVAKEYHGPIVISTGFTDKDYEQYVIDTFTENKQIYLLHCVSSYPTKLSDCNISIINHYAQLQEQCPKLIPGYSSHDLGSLASSLAVANGAKMIEKHVKLGDIDWVHFDKVAVDLKSGDFKNFVKDIRNAQMTLGSPEKRILPSEHHKYEVVNKS